MLRLRKTQKIREKREAQKRQGLSAQTFTEYVIVLGVVTVVLLSMGPFIQRYIQASILIVADQVGNQQEGDQQFDDKGYLRNAVTETYSTTTKEEWGYGAYQYDTTVETRSTTDIGLGQVLAPVR